MSIMNLIIFSGILSIIYGFWAGNSVLKSDAGNEKMQEISSAIQVGAQAYLNRQYTTIAIVGLVICVLLYLFFLYIKYYKIIASSKVELSIIFRASSACVAITTLS